jgi:hypothetical protein
MTFDKTQDKIAITVPFFELLLNQDGPNGNNRRRRNEPFLVTLAVDSQGAANPKIGFNATTFPGIRRGERVDMLGDGHLVYGPSNPGEFVAVSVLLMESDAEYRNLGDKLKNFVQDSAVQAGLKALLAANATAGAIAMGLAEATSLLARMFKDNQDDEVLRVAGAFFRDRPVPYDVNRQATRKNADALMGLKVIPLDVPNGQGTNMQSLSL